MSTQAIKTALDGLVEAVATPVALNDLGRLARMHSFGQVLAQADAASGIAGHAALRALAANLVLLLEKLILAEAARPQEGGRLLPDIVRLLGEICDGKAGDVDPLVKQISAAITGQPLPAAAPSAPPPVEAPTAQAAAPREEHGEPEPEPAELAEPISDGPVPGEGPYVPEPLVLDLAETEHLQGFIEESREHMEAIEAGLLEVERDPSNAEKINELFRPFHTIKGIAGFLNLRDINRLTHELETILDLGRKEQLQITSATVDRIFGAVDLLKAQIAAVQQFLANPQGQVCPQPNVAAMVGHLRAIARGQSVSTGEGSAAAKPRLGEVLIATEAAYAHEVEDALETQAHEDPPRKLGEILVNRGAVSEKQVDSALEQQVSGKTVDQTIRVDTAKLDTLVEAVGELVIAQTMVNLSEGIRGDPKLTRDVGQVTKIVRDVQETAMGLRMMPIGGTFQKMKRLVRDVARKVNKRVELHTRGEDTELDKTVIQQISDPLVHMVRNAVDHGIESPEERRAAGKSETGNVYLDAYHQGDSIVIEICDDGRGLDAKELIEKGIERGLVGPDETLTDQQAYALIVQPGFSLAENVTDISGRGVGMDVVKRNIDALRGKLEIQSELGHGTTFWVRLPLTLAIIDGMLVRAGNERLVIPTILIEQSLRPQRSQISTVQQRGEMLLVRGELCPLIQLGQLFGYAGRVDPCKALVVIAHCEGQKIGLVVDELIGQQQVVIKSLAESFKHVRGVSGAAILGDGRVGLILEPTGLLRMHNQRRRGVRPTAMSLTPTERSSGAPVTEEPLVNTVAADRSEAAVAMV